MDDEDIQPHFDVDDLKREIGLLNQNYTWLEKRRTEILVRLKKVNGDIKENRRKVELYVDLIHKEKARGEKVE